MKLLQVGKKSKRYSKLFQATKVFLGNLGCTDKPNILLITKRCPQGKKLKKIRKKITEAIILALDQLN